MDRTRAYWLCQVAGWSLFHGLQLSVHTENWAPGEIQTTLLTWALRVALGIGLTHAFRAYARRHGWTRLSLKQLVPRSVAASVVVGVLFTGLKILPVLLGPLRRVARSRIDPPLAWGVIGDMLMVGTWMAIYLGVHAAWSYRQAEVDRWKLQARAEAARLDALKLQLNPHFFFNSLASVRSLISEAPRRAKKMVARLARLLRKTLQASDEETVSLREELSTTQTYLQLEKVRFEDRLDWTIDAPESILDRSVPFMLVQTLAENAVKHGVGQRRGGGTIRVEASVEESAHGSSENTRSSENTGSSESALRLRVANPGRLEGDAGSTRGSGTGLDNARERLRLLYGDEASLTLEQSGPETVTATVRLPHPSRTRAGDTLGAEPVQQDPPTAEERPQGAERSNGVPQTGTDPSLPESSRDRPSAPQPEGKRRSALGKDNDKSRTRLLVGPPSYWACQVMGWGLIPVGVLLQNIIEQNAGWGALLETLIGGGFVSGLGIALTHLFRIYANRQEWAALPPRRLLPRVGAAAVLLGSTYILILLLPGTLLTADLPAAWLPWLRAVLDKIIPPAFGFSVLMGAWMTIYFGVHAAWNYRQAEIDRWKLQARAETARLKALKLQLNPHFFFNSLASVRSLISEAPARARKMVGRLARLLREALQASDKKTVPLQDELSTTRTYLKLEKVRFEDRLDWIIDAGEAALQRQVPYMLVQTLVENAVKHGIGQRRAGGTIRVEASVEGEESPLRLQVANPGTLGETADPERGRGTGLENARERLRLLFGEEAALALEQSGPETVTATAQIPRPSALEDQLPEDRLAEGADKRQKSAPTPRDAVPAGAGSP
ncbi:LytS/YehU family sensor histidine kinase [Salinibacter ruber]|uniref:sensor histidine kinase n=1 Tax=Salinibacter ruber TaxID=146919 RepID=UPI0021674014|nr:histidine kinase [Salinibacter ruber]MCS3665264.1 LytS/YehU family sensor histidine kinase [Salinibacter ruber]